MRTVIASLVAAAFSSAALAQSIESHYTSTAEKACKSVDKAKEGDGDWVVLSCPGRAGLVVSITEDDLRTTVSAGRTIKAAGRESAAPRERSDLRELAARHRSAAVKEKRI